MQRTPWSRAGALAEWIAAAHLRLTGWSVVGRNVRVAGVEVDLIARRGDTEALVEVKSWRRPPRGLPRTAADLVPRAQRRRLARAARAWADRRDGRVGCVRVDLVEVRWGGCPTVRRHAGFIDDDGCLP